MQADRGFIEHKQRVGEVGAQGRGEAYALDFASGERAALAVKREVAEAHVHEVDEAPADFAEIGRLAHALCRETHQLRSRIYYATGLGNGRLGVHCGSRSHRLDTDGIVSPDGSVADTHLQGGPAMITEF